jgi:hypothetical protein
MVVERDQATSTAIRAAGIRSQRIGKDASVQAKVADRQERKEKKKKRGEIERHRSDCGAVATPGRTKAQRSQGAEHERPLNHLYVITWCENRVGTEYNHNEGKISMT